MRTLIRTLAATVALVALVLGTGAPTALAVRDPFDPDGNQIGTFKTSSFDRTVFADGGQDSTFTVSRYQGSGPYESCHGGYLLKIVDYEVQVEHFYGPHCS